MNQPELHLVHNQMEDCHAIGMETKIQVSDILLPLSTVVIYKPVQLQWVMKMSTNNNQTGEFKRLSL